jgi:serine/threonine protein kinase
VPLRGEAARPTYAITGRYPTGAGRAVYRAYHFVFNGPCIQKTVSLVGLADAMFACEPQLIEQMDHSHIVTIREAQFDPADPTMVTYVMPYYAGGSVQKYLETNGPFSVDHALLLGGHLLDALAYLHTEIGFVHRDTKPDNLLMDGPLTCGYLSDFGSAARMDPAGSVATAGVTLPYLDPAAATSGRMTVQSDVYSVGMTTFEMLCGTLLPTLDPAKATARLGRGQRAYSDSAFGYAPHIPALVRRLVNKALQVDPTRRFATAADMASAVARARDQVIDWRHVTGVGHDGEWHGSWPPNRPMARRRIYRVRSDAVMRGARAGQRHLEASYLTGTSTWRRFGGLVEYVGATDHTAVSRFFDTVDDAVAHIRAAR